MKLYAPSYYSDFKCISFRCKHNCCIGWEIDIDEDTLDYYKSLDGYIGDKLSNNIEATDTPHFKLQAGDRCPFLNAEGLCELIVELGENSLCQICSDHPRFKNYYSSRVEIGLGLCCEAACELILNDTEPFTIDVVGKTDDEEIFDEREKEYFKRRDSIFKILCHDGTPLDLRIQEIINIWNIDFINTDPLYWFEKLTALERLDSEWDDYLLTLKKRKFSINKLNFENELIAKNILCYFIYRHLCDGFYEDDIKRRIKFCILSLYLVFSISESGKDIYEVARMYSAEIEYSDENIQSVIDLL